MKSNNKTLQIVTQANKPGMNVIHNRRKQLAYRKMPNSETMKQLKSCPNKENKSFKYLKRFCFEELQN